jgi:AraC-like DNA-binding protein
VDVLTDLLERSRARGAAFSHTTVHGDTGVRFPAAAGLAVHAVVGGEMYLWAGDAGRALRLLPGDIALVRGSVGHHLAHRPGVACTPLADVLASGPLPGSARRFGIGAGEGGAGEVAGEGGAGEGGDRPPTGVFFCGAYLFEGDLCAGLLEALPETVHVRPPAGSALRATVDLLATEMLGDEPGQQTLLDRLLDVALVHVLRHHFAADAGAAPPWFRALGDPHVGAALRALHDDPARAWTVADLAAVALLSRAAFARRFTALLGVSPLAYLTDWRMALARERLRDPGVGLAAVAASVGYGSEFSFSAAFKRRHGVSPGRWRAGHRPAPALAG